MWCNVVHCASVVHWLIYYSINNRHSCLLCPGCLFGCICYLFAGHRFAAVIDAKFNTAVAVPEFPVIDDSWRQSLLSSADSSFSSSADDSLHNPLDATAGPVMSTPLSDSRSLLASQGWGDDDEKYRGKCRARTRYGNSASDNLPVSPSVSFLHKRHCLKRRRSQTPVPGDDDGVYRVQKQRKRSLSQILPLDSNSCTELGETRRKKRRRLKRTLPFNSDDCAETVGRKQRRRSSTGRSSTPRTHRKKITEDATSILTPSQEQVVKTVRGRDVVTGGKQTECTGTDNAAWTNNAVVSSSASCHAELRLRNVITGKCYVLQPVVKVKLEFHIHADM